LAVILQDGMRRMYVEQEDVYYYITVMNENYAHPDIPEGAEDGIRRGMYLFRDAGDSEKKVQLIGSGAILREVISAADVLQREYGVSSDIWSATSFTELQRDGEAVLRHNRLNPEDEQSCWVEQCMGEREGPVIASTDYVAAQAEKIRGLLPQDDYYTLGTDGFGRSDTRENLRRFFEVDSRHVTYTALYGLYKQGRFDRDELLKARDRLEIDPGTANPARS
jgi:pyruvate dehydrogenase E1 component